MKLEQRLWLVQIGLVLLALLSAPLSAYSQGCALCYTQAASAGARMIASLRNFDSDHSSDVDDTWRRGCGVSQAQQLHPSRT